MRGAHIKNLIRLRAFLSASFQGGVTGFPIDDGVKSLDWAIEQLSKKPAAPAE